MVNQYGVAFGYIDKDARLDIDEVARLCDKDLKILLRHKKLYLVLDLDHPLLTQFSNVTQEKGYLMNPDDPICGLKLLFWWLEFAFARQNLKFVGNVKNDISTKNWLDLTMQRCPETPFPGRRGNLSDLLEAGDV
ncbi:hypothetical protein Tco_0286097 [Tanacetum coccineum]